MSNTREKKRAAAVKYILAANKSLAEHANSMHTAYRLVMLQIVLLVAFCLYNGNFGQSLALKICIPLILILMPMMYVGSIYKDLKDDATDSGKILKKAQDI